MKGQRRETWALASVLACACASNTNTNENSAGRSEEATFYPALGGLGGAGVEPKVENPWVAGFGASSGEQTGDSDPAPAISGTAGADGAASGSGHEEEAVDQPRDPEQTSLPPASDRRLPWLVMTEYGEGSGSDKRLGFSNQGEGIDGSCQIAVYANGASKPWRTIDIEPLPAPGEEVVLCSTNEARPGCTGAMSGSLYNGDDAIVVECESEVTDSFGQVGFDPGEAWASAGDRAYTTKDVWLARCPNAPSDTDPLDVFEPSGSWVFIEPGESPEDARYRCQDALGEGGASGSSG